VRQSVNMTDDKTADKLRQNLAENVPLATRQNLEPVLRSCVITPAL
jgi:hypothetical protein